MKNKCLGEIMINECQSERIGDLNEIMGFDPNMA